MRTSKGEYRWFHSTGQATWDEHGQPLRMAGSIRDVTEQRRVEETLRERAWLSQIGQMAAVVAHEVRNPLAAIRGVVEIIQTRFPASSPERQVLENLLARVDALDELVQDLLVYARPTSLTFDPVPILSLVRETTALLKNDPEFAGVTVEVTGADAALSIDSTGIGRVLMNVMTNAAQAMEGRGHLRVEGTLAGASYRIVIADTGPGIAPDALGRIFDPFYTTRSRGTGLGLPIVKRIVTQHGGEVTATSTPGVGTEVTIELPVIAS